MWQLQNDFIKGFTTMTNQQKQLINNKFKQLNKKLNITRLLLALVILWNIGLTINQQSTEIKPNIKVIEQGEIKELPTLPVLPIGY